MSLLKWLYASIVCFQISLTKHSSLCLEFLLYSSFNYVMKIFGFVGSCENFREGADPEYPDCKIGELSERTSDGERSIMENCCQNVKNAEHLDILSEDIPLGAAAQLEFDDNDSSFDEFTFDKELHFGETLSNCLPVYENSRFELAVDFDAESNIFRLQIANIPCGIPKIPINYIERDDLTTQLLKRLRLAKRKMCVIICGHDNDSSSSIG